MSNSQVTFRVVTAGDIGASELMYPGFYVIHRNEDSFTSGWETREAAERACGSYNAAVGSYQRQAERTA